MQNLDLVQYNLTQFLYLQLTSTRKFGQIMQTRKPWESITLSADRQPYLLQAAMLPWCFGLVPTLIASMHALVLILLVQALIFVDGNFCDWQVNCENNKN